MRPFGWKIAVPGTLVILLTSIYMHELALKRSARYHRIRRTESEVFVNARKREPPAFVFELRRVEEVAALKGGSVWLPLDD